jgi:small nuclear ribonucleoprotein E
MSYNELAQHHRKKGRESINTVTQMCRFMERRAKVEIWTNDDPNLRFQGVISGLDEWMNLVLDQVVEVNIKKKTQVRLGRIMLRGDNICLIHTLESFSNK